MMQSMIQKVQLKNKRKIKNFFSAWRIFLVIIPTPGSLRKNLLHEKIST